MRTRSCHARAMAFAPCCRTFCHTLSRRCGYSVRQNPKRLYKSAINLRISLAIYAVSPHPRGVDRNIAHRPRKFVDRVSPHPRGVDRNSIAQYDSTGVDVSPHPRGVDRNHRFMLPLRSPRSSPLTRGEWIEMSNHPHCISGHSVSPHPRGVDRNPCINSRTCQAWGLPSPEGSG